MLDLSQYNSLAAALRDALERWPYETCLIEADRDRENCRLTYRQFKEAALPLARFLQDTGFSSGSRAAIIMVISPAIPITVCMGAIVFSASLSVRLLILQTSQKPASFIQGTSFDPQPIANPIYK